jgi:hypothetical protein
MFVSAQSKSKTVMSYRDENGVETTRSGGTRSWRNFNPGNISKGSFADSCGAIGADSRFAAFPDETTGLAAIVSLFKAKSYRDLTLRKAIYRYAPPSDNNDSEAYVDAVSRTLGVSAETIVHDLDQLALDRLAQAIKKHEGWKPGVEATGGPVAAAGDAAIIQKLVQIGSDKESCDEIRAKAFKAMAQIYGKPTARNACACTLSMFLKAAGIQMEIIFGAGKLARFLEKNRLWERVKIGQQRPGDVGVTLDETSPFGADHIFLVVERIDDDKMLIADNQSAHSPHERYASGKGGKTPVDYFLRASGASDDEWNVEIVEEDQDTNNLIARYNPDGSPIAIA